MMELFFLFSGFILVLSTTHRHALFTNPRYGNDVIMRTGVLRKFRTSKIFCATVCYRRRECRGYFYNTLTGVCQLQAIAYNGHQEVVKERGWQYFNIETSDGRGQNSSKARKLDQQPRPESIHGVQTSNNRTSFPGTKTSKVRSLQTTTMFRLLSKTSTTREPSKGMSTSSTIPFVSTEIAEGKGKGDITHVEKNAALDASKSRSEEPSKFDESGEEMVESDEFKNDKFSKELNKSDESDKELVKSNKSKKEMRKSDELKKELNKLDKSSKEMGKAGEFNAKLDEFDESLDESKALKPNDESNGRMDICEEGNTNLCMPDGQSKKVIQSDASNEKITTPNEDSDTIIEKVDLSSEIPRKSSGSSEDFENHRKNKKVDNSGKYKELDNPGRNKKVDSPGRNIKKLGNPHRSIKNLDNHDKNKELKSPTRNDKGLSNSGRNTKKLNRTGDLNKTLATSDGRLEKLDTSDARKTKLGKSSGRKDQFDTRSEYLPTTGVSGENAVIKKVPSDLSVEHVSTGHNSKESKITQKPRHIQGYRIATMDQKESLEVDLHIQASLKEDHGTAIYKETDWCNHHPNHPLCFAIAEKRKKRNQKTSALDSALIPLAVVGVLLPTLLGLIYAARTGFDAIKFRRPQSKFKDELKVTLVEA